MGQTLAPRPLACLGACQDKKNEVRFRRRVQEGGISRQVKFAVVNFAVVNFAVRNFVEPPGFCVVPLARVHRVYRWCARNSRRTRSFAWEISRSI